MLLMSTFSSHWLHSVFITPPLELPQYPCNGSPLIWTLPSLSILKNTHPEYSLEGLMLQLQLQYFGHVMWKANTEKDPDAGKDWGQEEKGATKDEMVGWPQWLNGHKHEQTPGDSEEQGSLVCCSPRCRKDWDTTERLNNPLCLLQDAPQSTELQFRIYPKFKILHQLPLCTQWGLSSLAPYISLLQSSPSTGTST